MVPAAGREQANRCEPGETRPLRCCGSMNPVCPVGLPSQLCVYPLGCATHITAARPLLREQETEINDRIEGMTAELAFQSTPQAVVGKDVRLKRKQHAVSRAGPPSSLVECG